MSKSVEKGRVSRLLTHGFANISTEQCSAVTVFSVHELDNVLSFFSAFIVEVKVDDVDSSLGIVDRRPDGDAEDVTQKLVERPPSFCQFAQERIPGLIVLGPNVGGSTSCQTSHKVLCVMRPRKLGTQVRDLQEQ